MIKIRHLSLGSARATGGVDFGLLKHGELRKGSNGTRLTGTAVDLRFAGGVLTYQFTLRLRAFGLMAFPVTLGLLTYGLALRTGGLAVGNTVGGLADSNTLRAVFGLASFIRALNFTFRLFALNIAYGVPWLLAGCMASGGFTNRVTDSRALGIITLPCAFRVTLGVVCVRLRDYHHGKKGHE